MCEICWNMFLYCFEIQSKYRQELRILKYKILTRKNIRYVKLGELVIDHISPFSSFFGQEHCLCERNTDVPLFMRFDDGVGHMALNNSLNHNFPLTSMQTLLSEQINYAENLLSWSEHVNRSAIRLPFLSCVSSDRDFSYQNGSSLLLYLQLIFSCNYLATGLLICSEAIIYQTTAIFDTCLHLGWFS